MAEKTYFSLPAAARELGVSTDVLRRQYRSGLIAAIKTPGGQPRFTTETIERIKQNGWPHPAPSENEIDSIPNPASQEAVSDGEFPNSLAAPPRPINQEELDFRTMQREQARACQGSEQRRKQNLFHFHRRWIDYSLGLLPYWLNPEQVTEVSRQISNEIKGHTSEDELWMSSLCEDIVRLAILPLNRQREMAQARGAALIRVLAKIPSDATDSEKARFQALASNAIQRAGEQLDGETLFAAAWHAVSPILAAVELRRKREKLRVLALQKLPWQANEKEQREGRAAINRVIEQMSGEEDEAEIHDKIEDALEPIGAAIPKRIEDERRSQRIAGLLSAAKLHVGTYLNTLYNGGELDYEAICDWGWRRELEGIVDAQLREQLRGDETSTKLRELVEKILNDELEDPEDDEWE
jgi:hypothetical protein